MRRSAFVPWQELASRRFPDLGEGGVVPLVELVSSHECRMVGLRWACIPPTLVGLPIASLRKMTRPYQKLLGAPDTFQMSCISTHWAVGSLIINAIWQILYF